MEEIKVKEKNLIVNKIVGALLFSVFGLMGFFFSLWKENWNSAVWCVLLELSCTLLLTFNKPYLTGSLHVKYNASFFRIMKYAAIMMTVCSWCAFAAYIVVGAIWQETFDVKSHYAAAPVALMSGFWFFVSIFDFRKYEILLE